jgi:tight adherence protein B
MGPDVTFILAAISAFIAVAGAGFALTAGGPSKRQAKRISRAAGGEAVKASKRKGGQDQTAARRRQIQDSIKELEERQKRERKKTLTLRARIEQAGLDWKPIHFWMLSGGAGLVAGLLTFLTGQHPLIAIAFTATAAFGLPRWILGFMRSSRQKKFSASFADALDIIVRGVKSGLPLNECLKIIANEAPEPVKSEFATLVEGIGMGVETTEGMRRLKERMPLPAVNFFAIVLVIQSKSGGNLAEALQNLSTVLRARKMMREKIGALSSEAKASALIIGALPPGVLGIVSVMSPDYMSLMFTHPLGQMMLMGGAIWMGFGILMMRGMINFKH